MIAISKRGGGFDKMWLYIDGQLRKVYYSYDEHYIYKKGIIKKANDNKLEDQYEFDGKTIKKVLKDKLSDEYMFNNGILKKKENDKFSDRWSFDGKILQKLDNSEEWGASYEVPLLVMMVAAGIIRL